MKNIFVVFLLVSFFSCKTEQTIVLQKEYLRHVGDIQHDPSVDDPDFKVCNGEDKINQYFNAGKGPIYVDEKSSLSKAFNEKFKPVLDESQDGLVRIRFIVNCEGKAGRFRVLQADSNYQATEFDEHIISQLMEITEEIEDWVVLYTKEKKPIDYYFYLIFRIDDGYITEILP